MAEELDIIFENVPQPKYALLSFGQYFKFNHDLSVLRGWEIGKPTERVFEMSPQAAKINIEYDSETGEETGYNAALVMRISSDIQESNPELIEGLKLVPNYIPVDVQVSEIIATGLTSNVIDWTLIHFLKVGSKKDGLILWLESEARSQLSDEAVEMLNELGITIISPE